MSFNSAPNAKREKIPAEKNILDCVPGRWETLAETVSLWGLYRRPGTPERLMASLDMTSMTVDAGTQINVLGVQEDRATGDVERVGIEFHHDGDDSNENFWLYCGREDLKKKKIKVLE